MSSLSRRDFAKYSLRAGAGIGLGNLAFVEGLRPVSADEVKVRHERVQLSPDIEPLVRLIEDTDRERLLGAVAAKIRAGTSYQDVLAALMLAGVRGIKPRPVGFKFHAVLVVNSAHLASLAAPDRERWLPLFWALDNFKSSQARNRVEGDWAMAPPAEGHLPSAAQAKARFIEAMDNWDEEGADRAVTSLARSAGAGEMFELFLTYGCRDFRDIGHKAIYVANSWRTMQTIGWRHAEPVLRSLAFALLEHEAGNPAQRDAEADRPGRENQKRLTRIRKDWTEGKVDPAATRDLLGALRHATPAEAGEHVVGILNRKVSPASVWDALFLMGGELLMRQPGIVGIHCVTATNALHYGFQTSGIDRTRRLLMLQAAAFLTMFRKAMQGRGALASLRLDELQAADMTDHGTDAIQQVLADVSKDRLTAARKTLALVSGKHVDPDALMREARRLIFSKGRDAHDYKFSSAALEDYYHATPAWRARYLASSMFNLRGALDPDNGLVKRTRAAFGS